MSRLEPGVLFPRTVRYAREIQLTVSDLGVGFDPQDLVHRRGIGLRQHVGADTIGEREFSSTSQPGRWHHDPRSRATQFKQ